MVKRLLSALGCILACARPAPPAVSVAALPAVPAPAEVTDGTLLEDCRIVGTGEPRDAVDDENEAPFGIFAADDAREASLVVARPELVHVTWSHFPTRADRGRARVDLGGQAHVRWDRGWADLYGRTFTTKKLLVSVPGHLWARAGAPIEMMSAAGGTVFARVRTPFVAPKTIVVRGNCADVVYEPRLAPARAPSRAASATNHDATLRLFASPGEARPFTTVAVAGAGTVALAVLERRTDFARVFFESDRVGFDAWVPASQLGDDTARPSARPVRAAIAVAAPPALPRARVARDSALYVSDVAEPPTALAGAVVEANAAVAFDPASVTSVDGHELVAFEFVDGMITSPTGRRMWLSKRAFAP